ncbi:hypothetical protein ACFU9Y_03755 [Streptomyces sp. NPDC057621]|uniref:Uncharacterized protein n=1 Tax=Streptomyces liliiviolaceus TaxID=2823109 RepID=A0A941BBM7_9ACTN|nr:hypothetical protein [Streptomyces liliiviolaceus]MBQ0847514.1 hypothetical protein [Streptomyces liliiviolaceus]
MLFCLLLGIGVKFAITQLVQARLGFAGLVLLALLLVGVRAGYPRLAWWSAGLFFLLTLQLQA